MKNLPRLLFACVVFLAAACGKDDDTSPAKENQEETCRITKSTYDQIINEFRYNSAGKVSRVDIIHPASADNSHQEMLYDAAGNLKEIRSFDVNNRQQFHQTYTYNSANLPDTIYLFHQDGNGITVADGFILHQYNSAKQLLKTGFFPNAQATVPNNSAEFTYPAPGQAIGKQFLKNAAGNLQLETTAYYQFDDKINPLTNLAYLNQLGLLLPHNIIAFQMTYHASGLSTSQTTAFQYNDHGYPVSYTISSPDFPSVSGTYEYSCQ